MTRRPITFWCPQELIDRMDIYGESRYSSRSQVLRDALVEFLKRRQPEVKP